MSEFMSRTENKGKAKGGIILGLLAILIASGGVGYIIFQGQQVVSTGDSVIEENDGEESIELKNVYYCSSEEDIHNAVNEIGNGSGNIIIIESFILMTKISLNQEAHYVIEGLAGITISPIAGQIAIEIGDVRSCIINNLVINASRATGTNDAIIYVSGTEQSPITLQNIAIIGDADCRGVGIEAASGNLFIDGCRFQDLNRGIHLRTSNSRIQGCYFNNIAERAVYLSDEDGNIVDGNTIEIVSQGIYSTSNHHVISNNFITKINLEGIRLSGVYSNSVTGNRIFADNSVSSIDSIYGIYIVGTSSRSNAITGNIVTNIYNQGTGIGYAIYLVSGTDNVIVGNSFWANEEDTVQDGGTGNIIANNIEG